MIFMGGLLLSRRFAPYFGAMFLGAFNDNFYKSAIVILITYHLASGGGDASLPVSAAAGVFILPFVIFSPLAGQLANKYERSLLVRRTKLAEIAVMGLGAAAFHLGSVALLMIVLFLMGAQSAFFGPLKYGVIPMLVRQDELLAANGLVEMGTFLATLLGTIFGGLAVGGAGGPALASASVVGIAALGWLASLAMPRLDAVSPSLRIRLNPFTEAASLFRDAASSRRVFSAILGISWFYFVGAAYLSQFPIFAKNTLGADERVATLFLAVFSVGIGVGSVACGKLLGGRVSGRFAPASMLGIALFGAGVWALCPPPSVTAGELVGIAGFMASPRSAALLFCLFAISFLGGIYVVPLYSIMQHDSGPERAATATACLNITDSAFITGSSVFIGALLFAGLSIPGVILAVSALCVVASALIRPLAREGSCENIS